MENQEKKTSNFFLLLRFYTGRQNVTNKSCLFYAKFFEFEEFSIESFFCSSIQPQHAVQAFLKNSEGRNKMALEFFRNSTIPPPSIYLNKFRPEKLTNTYKRKCHSILLHSISDYLSNYQEVGILLDL